ncbi:uncharacterized protein MELLADRAFT_96386 [Melampsora larici-populina 98AG31]|uniref:Uncharacterized protein n=1 Tax=Melampsora larici-populina (strain 98AG31 / pathotype 3-4-7) TaxID=747676 RepID=F4REL0_MELLP|nr:uncharacterized protein MELLADRAFT_96386 [Melampsora larici-populina 98AG31]EGG09259.1 hypothetical protein MELLADRAFT_96386 [Melampsora larici-populina 98AG31]
MSNNQVQPGGSPSLGRSQSSNSLSGSLSSLNNHDGLRNNAGANSAALLQIHVPRRLNLGLNRATTERGGLAPRTASHTLTGLRAPLRGTMSPGLRSASRTLRDRSRSPVSRGNTPQRGGAMSAGIGLLNRGAGEVGDGLQSRILGPSALEFFEGIAESAGLDAEHATMARAQCEMVGDNRMIAETVINARILMEITKLSNQVEAVSNLANQVEELSNLAKKVDDANTHLLDLTESVQHLGTLVTPGAAAQPVVPVVPVVPGRPIMRERWTASSELLAERSTWQNLINPMALKFLGNHDLESYTALKSPKGDLLANSLFNKIKVAVLDQGVQWTTQHLPVQFQGVEDVEGTRHYNSAIKNVCKHAREKLHHTLLSGIHDPKTGEVFDQAVPNIKTLMFRIAQTCDTLAGCNKEALWVASTSHMRARAAYLRREAARIYQRGRGSSSIWSNVDQQLARLRAGGADYTLAFYDLIYNQDSTAFTGDTFFHELRDEVELRLPAEADVIAATEQGPVALLAAANPAV